MRPSLPRPRRRARALVAGALSLASLPTLALGIAAPDTVPVWGRPLDVRLKVSGLQEAQALRECFQVDVLDGERSVPPFQVSWSVEPPTASAGAEERWLRVRTAAPLREPVVTLQVEAQCGGRLLRSLTLLPEPLATDLAPSGATLAEAPATQAPAPHAPHTLRLAALDPPAAGRRRAQARDRAQTREARPQARPSSNATASGAASAQVASVDRRAGARLQLSAPTLVLGLVEGAGGANVFHPLPPVRGAAGVTPVPRAATLAGGPDEAVQRELSRLGTLVREQQALISRLEARAPVYSVPMDPWLAGGALAAVATAGALFLRLRRMQRERAPWFDSSVLAYLDEGERSRLA